MIFMCLDVLRPCNKTLLHLTCQMQFRGFYCLTAVLCTARLHRLQANRLSEISLGHLTLVLLQPAFNVLRHVSAEPFCIFFFWSSTLTFFPTIPQPLFLKIAQPSLAGDPLPQLLPAKWKAIVVHTNMCTTIIHQLISAFRAEMPNAFHSQWKLARIFNSFSDYGLDNDTHLSSYYCPSLHCTQVCSIFVFPSIVMDEIILFFLSNVPIFFFFVY